MIEARGLTKSFNLYRKPSDRLKELVLRRSFHTRHDALKGISFRVNAGETLGVVGRNGAGKSTLLKILNGVAIPDAGEVIADGPVTGLLELGTGFDPALSGVDNIRTNGLLIGMTDEQITRRQGDIIQFAELGEFIHEPLRTYSSGMAMRLAFSIAYHAHPRTFLIDEALSVGDGHFQQKCMRKIREFRDGGGSIIFVSHDLNAIKMLCDRVLVLDKGLVALDGDPETAVNHYNQLLAGDVDEARPGNAAGGYGSFEAIIQGARVRGVDSAGAVLTSGETAVLEVDVVGREDIGEISLGMMIRDRFGQDMFGTNTHLLQQSLAVAQGEQFRLVFRFPMLLRPGKYTVTLALHEGPDHTRRCYHWWDNACQFEVSGIRGHEFAGICNLSPTLEKIEL